MAKKEMIKRNNGFVKIVLVLMLRDVKNKLKEIKLCLYSAMYIVGQ